MFIFELPIEIISQILSNISNMEDLHECTQVCKSWRRELVPAYYKDMLVQKDHEHFLRQVQTKIDDNGGQIGDFIKTLTFDGKVETSLSREDFELLLNAMPSLQAIRFNASNVYRLHQYLIQLDIIASRTKLQEVSIIGYLYNDGELRYEEICELHHSINQQLQHQITTLSIFETSINFIGDDQEIFDYVNGFINLKDFTLHSTDIQHGAESFKDVTSVLDACCDSLQSLNLDIDSNDSSYATGDHVYHPNLTSLTLSTPELGECYINYILEYLPNLKELDIIASEYFAFFFSEMYVSMQPDMSFRFNSYLKQLQRFRCSTASVDSFSRRDTFWQTVREIYDNQTFCDLTIHLYTGNSFIYETISFDKHGFNVDCYFEKERFNSIAHSFDFFSLNSINVNYSKLGVERRIDTDDDRCMLDLLTFAASQQQAQVHLTLDEERLILSTEPVFYDSNFRFPQDLACAQYAYLDKVQLEDNLLNNINTLYPTIENIQLINCRIDENNDNVIDLRQFKNLQELTLDFDQVQKEHQHIVFQWANGDQEKHYSYDGSISALAMYSIVPANDIPKGTHTLKLKTTDLRRLILQRGNRNIELINT